MSRALDHLAALHRRSRGAGQTHAVLAGAVAWAETAPRGVLRILVGNAVKVSEILTRLARQAPSARVVPARREVLFPSGAAVRVVDLAEWEIDGAGASGPVLLDGTAVAAIGDDAATEFAALRGEVVRLRMELEMARVGQPAGNAPDALRAELAAARREERAVCIALCRDMVAGIEHIEDVCSASLKQFSSGQRMGAVMCVRALEGAEGSGEAGDDGR